MVENLQVKINNMTNDELFDYIVSLLESTEIMKFSYEIFKQDDISVTKSGFKNNSGWEILKEDRWEEDS